MLPIVSHKAVIQAIEGDKVVLRLRDDPGADGCAACQLSAVCGTGHTSASPSTLTVTVADTRGLTPGMRVIASVHADAQWRAIALALAVPVLLLVAVLLALMALDVPAWIAALCAVATPMLYFVALKPLRRLHNHLWVIRPENNTI